MEKDYSELGVLFQSVIGHMKVSYPMWEELAGRAFKLHTALKGTIAALTGFLETFQKLSDHAIGSGGATKEIGSSLTRLCLRHKSIENRLKELTNQMLESLISPMQDYVESWKKTVVQIDKDHARDYKKAMQNVKKASTDTMKLKKKAEKGKSDARSLLDSAMDDLHSKHAVLEATEKNAIRTAMAEQRRHYCTFIKCLQPLMEHELALLSEITHLQEIMNNLYGLSQDAPSTSEPSDQVIFDATQHVVTPLSTLERQKRLIIDGETLSDRSASSSTGSIHNSIDSASSGSVMQQGAVDVARDSIQHSASGTSVQSSSSGQGPTIADIPLPYDRPHTISSSVYHHSRPVLAADTFDPPAATNATYGHRGTDIDSRTSTVATPKVAEIYARPSLLIGKEMKTMPVAVATPVVPLTSVKTAPTLREDNLAGVGSSSVNSSSERLPAHVDEASRQKSASTMSSDMSALAEAIRDLEANTAALQLPFNELQAPSCQSLDCSSGYGTMTNVSVGTACSHETITTLSDDFDGLAEALLSESASLNNKYCTLPNKRVTQSVRSDRTILTAVNRPASTTGLKANFPDQLADSMDARPLTQTSTVSVRSLDSANSGSSVDSSRTRNVDWSVGDASNLSAGLPPPPVQLLEDNHESDDDMPLPPPPDLDSIPVVAKNETPSVGAGPNSAALMHSLSVKLASRSSTVRAPPPVAAKSFRTPAVEKPAFVDHGVSMTMAAPSVECDSNSLLSQIQRGMTLRRTISNDRSAPRVSKN